MEAAGIEPASRERSMTASTCVVDNLVFRRPRPLSTGFADDYSGTFLTPGVPNVARGDSELATGFWGSPTKPLSQSYLFLGSQSKVAIGN